MVLKPKQRWWNLRYSVVVVRHSVVVRDLAVDVMREGGIAISWLAVGVDGRVVALSGESSGCQSGEPTSQGMASHDQRASRVG